jgi:predicted transcriptional regulator
MRVLLSIRPEFAQKIFDGQKRYEFRRSIFKRQDVKTVVVYASAPVSKVVGEFEVETILHESLDVLWRNTKHLAGITQEYFLDYFKDKSTGYAIAIRDCWRYESPFDLREVLGLAPPQSFMYLDCDPDLLRNSAAGSEIGSFVLGEDRYGDVDVELEYGFGDQPLCADERHWRLSGLLTAPGQELFSRYDFGDDWRHHVRLEKVLPAQAVRRARPPEDWVVPGRLMKPDWRR